MLAMVDWKRRVLFIWAPGKRGISQSSRRPLHCPLGWLSYGWFHFLACLCFWWKDRADAKRGYSVFSQIRPQFQFPETSPSHFWEGHDEFTKFFQQLPFCMNSDLLGFSQLFTVWEPSATENYKHGSMWKPGTLSQETQWVHARPASLYGSSRTKPMIYLGRPTQKR